MSITKTVRRAVYTALDVSAITDLGVTGIHHLQAPESSPLPFLVFNSQTGAEDIKTFSGDGVAPTTIAEDDYYQIRAHVDHASLLAAAIDKSPEDFLDDLLDVVTDTLEDGITLTSGELWGCYRIKLLPAFVVTEADRSIYSAGILVRIVATS